jgi:hypothetical protein
MFTFTVKPDNGEPYEVTAGSRDVLVWERTSKGNSFGSLRDGLHMGDLYRIAHIASRRLGLFTADLKTFEETCELDFDEEEEPDPTRPAP